MAGSAPQFDILIRHNLVNTRLSGNAALKGEDGSMRAWKRHTMRPMLVALVGASSLFCISPLRAQQADPAAQQADAADLAKQIQNPLASLVTVPLQANLNRGVGEFDRTVANLNFQPVIPFPGEKWNMIARVIVPFVSVPVGETAAQTGFGDTSLTLWASPADAGSVVWGAGLASQLPFSSNPELLGSGKLSVGPSAVVFSGAGKFTFGAVAQNVWSVMSATGGTGDRPSVNEMFAQWFLNYNLGGGWALGTAPIITCDWTADSGNECTIPWGLQVSKVMTFGRRPAKYTPRLLPKLRIPGGRGRFAGQGPGQPSLSAKREVEPRRPPNRLRAPRTWCRSRPRTPVGNG